MLDIAFIRTHADEVQENATRKGMDVDVKELLRVDEQLRATTTEADQLRQRKNETAEHMKSLTDKQSTEAIALVEEGKSIKQQLEGVQQQEEELKQQLKTLMLQVPNMTHPDVPVGVNDQDNKELRTWGDIPVQAEGAKDHVELGKELDLIDFEKGADVAGSGFYFLKNEAALLDLKLVQFAVQHCVNNGFEFMITPELVKKEIIEGAGFNPRTKEEKQIYEIEGEDLSLIATSEISVGGYFQNKTFTAAELEQPKKVVALSHCFRTEAGAYGKESKGLYRVHQFTKVEMFVLCKPEDSERMHQELLAQEESIMQALNIPYRVVDNCTGDLGAPAYRKYDIEAWMPFKQAYGEVTSTSNCTDFQARRLNIRYKNSSGKTAFVHTLNGTAIVTSRIPLVLLELHQGLTGVQIPTE